MTTDRIQAIPTVYRGVQFRSRLEARWACTWDLLGLNWEYEALELGNGADGTGYLPDFLIDAELYSHPQVKGPILVEVRPLLRPEQYREPINKIARSGWRGSAMVVGATLFPKTLPWGVETHLGMGHPSVVPEHANPDSDEWYSVGWFSDLRRFGMGGQDLTMIWREAGKRSRWQPPVNR